MGFGCGRFLGDVKSPRGSADAQGHVKVACGSARGNHCPSSPVAGLNQELVHRERLHDCTVSQKT